MEHARTENQGQEEEKRNSRIHGAVDDSKHGRLTDSTEHGERVAYKIELANLA